MEDISAPDHIAHDGCYRKSDRFLLMRSEAYRDADSASPARQVTFTQAITVRSSPPQGVDGATHWTDAFNAAHFH
ncbi:MAG: hypothetical protein ACLPJJ_08990 [Acidocella sp.]|uniref:hypothetical protein n=1 Tax=Acidocella sp. TaxID=50710 RepID=UPI003FBA9CE8